MLMNLTDVASVSNNLHPRLHRRVKPSYPLTAAPAAVAAAVAASVAAPRYGGVMYVVVYGVVYAVVYGIGYAVLIWSAEVCALAVILIRALVNAFFTLPFLVRVPCADINAG